MKLGAATGCNEVQVACKMSHSWDLSKDCYMIKSELLLRIIIFCKRQLEIKLHL